LFSRWLRRRFRRDRLTRTVSRQPSRRSLPRRERGARANVGIVFGLASIASTPDGVSAARINPTGRTR
jgi:hypothetical protein